MAMSGLVAVALLIAGIVILVLQSTGNVPDSSAVEALAICMVIAAPLKLILLAYLLRPTWQRVVAQNAAEKMHRQAPCQPGNIE
jgi:hypothetical protein